MESVLAQATTWWPRALRRVDGTVAATWALAAGLVLYLGFAGGGYDIVVSSQIGLVLWWILLIGAAAGILPHARLSRAGWAGLALLGAFTAWTALGATWSLSSELSRQDFSRVSTYLAVLLLALAIHRQRERAVRHTVSGVATAIVVIAGFAVISRVIPSSFPASHVTEAFLAGSQQRLSWPLNYWNGLAALMALGVPLLLAVATSARSLRIQAAAAGAIPLVALCAYLTFSRGGAVEIGAALLAFIALAPERIPKLATILTAAAGSAILILGALHRRAIEHGLSGHLAASQGHQLLIAVVLACGGVALAQVGIGLAVRHGTPPRLLQIPRPRARIILAGMMVVAIAVAFAVHVPSRLSHAWDSFKVNGVTTTSNLPARYGSLSGEGRYQYWKVALQATSRQRLKGSGPGTFQLLWQPRAPFYSPVINAHSLYVETLAEVGIVGLVLLVGLFVLLLLAAIRAVIRARGDARAQVAAVTATLLAFMVAASVDWVWQLPVLPAIFLLLAAAVLAPAARGPSIRQRLSAGEDAGEAGDAPGRTRRIVLRVGLGVVAAACLVGIAVPLASISDVRTSQSAVAAGDISAGLQDARSAVRVEPGAASPELQLALVLELRHDYPAAITAAQAAIRNESQDWSEWLVLSRLQAEAGNVPASVAAYRRARSLNPTSPLFHQ